MKRVFSFLLVLLLIPGLAGCGQKAPEGPTWQEQYDLGVKYLSEGNYEEAIIAFTAAIQIEPRQAPAYVGRGDAYVGTAKLAAGEQAAELPEESRTAYESAVTDYLAAIGLDKLLADVYGKAADVYLALGDRDSAIAILERGCEATGDEDLRTRAEALRDDRPEGASDTVTVVGTVISDSEYYDRMDAYWDALPAEQQPDYVMTDAFGIRFSQPVEVLVEGRPAVIREAMLMDDSGVIDNPDLEYVEDEEYPVVGRQFRLTGYFYKNEDTAEFSGPRVDEQGETYYYFRAFGDYVFFAVECEELS